MLVLTRKRSETIQIGDDIVVKVLKTGKRTVKIGIEAPKHVRVLRAELCEEELCEEEAPAMLEQSFEFDDAGSYSETAVACSDQYPQPYVA